MAANNCLNNNASVFTSDTNITSTAGNITATLGDIVITNGKLSVGGSTGTSGQLLIAATGANPAWASVSAGSGISITPGVNTLSIAATAPFAWTTIGADGALAANTGYIDTKAGLLTVSLPAVAAVGTTLILQGLGAGGWKITQAANQRIIMGNLATTVGVGGSMASTNANDSISLVCTTANLIWSTFSGVGNLTIV